MCQGMLFSIHILCQVKFQVNDYVNLSQAGGFPEPEIVHYNPKEFDFGKKKAFPFRDQVNSCELWFCFMIT